MNGEWISVTERLPEVAESVLIFHRPTDADGRPSCAGTPGCDGGLIETGFWESIEGDRHWVADWGGEVQPTHWMPLPAPPLAPPAPYSRAPETRRTARGSK